MSLEVFRALSDDELVRRFDLLVDRKSGPYPFGPNDFLSELDRRATERYAKRVDRWTVVVGLFTIVVAIVEFADRAPRLAQWLHERGW